MNLNKYNKAELISKVRNLQNKNQKSFSEGIKNYFTQILNLIITFKDLLLKLTLVSLIIGIFKKYKFFRKIWLIINTIIMGIFGLSLFDNSLITFFSNFINEIKFISYNVVDYLTNTNFYNYLSKFFKSNEILEIKEVIKTKEVIKEIKVPNDKIKPFSPEYYKTHKTDDPVISKLSEWLKPKTEEAMVPDNYETNYYKYILITTGVIITASLAWYYSDEIKTGFVSTLEWILSFRPGTGDGSGNDSNSSTTPTGPNLPIESTSADIQLVDKGKAKEVLTSPSLENLSNQAETAFRTDSPPTGAEYFIERPVSPSSSNSSTETITPAYPLNINTDVEPSSSSSNTPIGVDSNSMFNIIRKTWRNRIPNSLSEKLNYMESNFKNDLTEKEYKKFLIVLLIFVLIIMKLLKDMNQWK